MTSVLAPFMQILTPTNSPLPSPTLIQTSPRKRPRHVIEQVQPRAIEDLAAEVQELFQSHLSIDTLEQHSEQLQREYRDRLKSSAISMLPSYNHTLPTGLEQGKCLALDVGGSTFRVALIELVGRGNGDCIQTTHLQSFVIDGPIKRLEGQRFFDWMADRIDQTLTACRTLGLLEDGTLPMGLAWSFPIQETGPRSGNILSMGKGFNPAGVEGSDLSEVIMVSCRAKGLDVQMRAIVNDSAATLLSQAYRDPCARMSLILGTGMNSAVFLPVTALDESKLESRPRAWRDAAQHVLVNTELSMFGKNIMPVTRWDELLNKNHSLPDFQPMEYLCTGMYIGEIVRLVLLEAIETAGLFGGERPGRMSIPYSFDTRIVAAFESDFTMNMADAMRAFLAAHPLSLKPSVRDLLFVQHVARAVSQRAQAYIATALHALWMVRSTVEGLAPLDSCLTVACDGAVIEKYPYFRLKCQKVLQELCVTSGASMDTVTLHVAPESSIYGAAVAVACIKDV